jgi:Tfp pilus assembly protein PilN
MDLAQDALLFLHLLGMAALVGGGLVQVRASERSVNAAMLHGSLTQVVTGLALVGVLEAEEAEVDNAKIAVKFALAMVIALLVFVNRKKSTVPDGLYFGLLGLSVLTVGVAVFW